MNQLSDHYKKQIEDSIIETVFMRYGIDMDLLGGNILFFLVKSIAFYGMESHAQIKSYYKHVADRFSMSYSQIERDVRYSIRSSHFGGTRLKTYAVLRVLVEAVKIMAIEQNYHDFGSYDEVSSDLASD